MFSLESPHRGHFNEYKQYTIFSMKKKITLNYPKSAVMDFFQWTKERVRNSRGKRATRVRANEVLLYMYCDLSLELSQCDSSNEESLYKPIPVENYPYFIPVTSSYLILNPYYWRSCGVSFRSPNLTALNAPFFK